MSRLGKKRYSAFTDDAKLMCERDAALALAEFEYNADLERLSDQMRLAGRRHADRVADIHNQYKTAKAREGVATGDMDCGNAVGGPHLDETQKR